METRSLCGDDISLLGFGLMRLPRTPGQPAVIDEETSLQLINRAMAKGVNYFDTAYTYGGSEAFAGRALSRYPRGSYYLATKCPPWMVHSAGDFERIFAEQQERCKTEYFDYYLVHNLARESTRASSNPMSFGHFEAIGFYQMLQKKKAEGKIRHIGFSFHGTPSLLQTLTDRYEWDFAQIQINYIDWADTHAQMLHEILVERGIPIIVMEPLRGGALASLTEEAVRLLQSDNPGASAASWGIRYAASLPHVASVLSGMNTMAQLEDNVATMEGFSSIRTHEIALLSQAAALYKQSGAIPCTGCGYCMPCPEGVDIPGIISIYNHYRRAQFRIPFDNGYSNLEEREKASSCVRCGKCVEKCPQGLPIPAHMEEIHAFANTADQ